MLQHSRCKALVTDTAACLCSAQGLSEAANLSELLAYR